MKDIIIKELNNFEDLQVLVELEHVIWGMAEADNMSTGTIKAVISAGGLALAAFDKEQAVAFAFGFPAYKNDGLGVGFHSHILGVLPKYQSLGLGKKLKLKQREWCLSKNMNWMTWTFDPLQAGNAKFNIEYLGAVSNTYKINEYGLMGGELNAELPSDRLLAFWDLSDDRVVGLLDGHRLEPASIKNLEPALVSNLDKPVIIKNATAKAISLEIPPNLNKLVKSNPKLALKWRLALRELLIKYFAKGYRIERFIDNSYILLKYPNNPNISRAWSKAYPKSFATDDSSFKHMEEEL